MLGAAATDAEPDVQPAGPTFSLQLSCNASKDIGAPPASDRICVSLQLTLLTGSSHRKPECEHLPVSRVVMYSISLLGCFVCMYKA